MMQDAYNKEIHYIGDGAHGSRNGLGEGGGLWIVLLLLFLLVLFGLFSGGLFNNKHDENKTSHTDITLRDVYATSKETVYQNEKTRSLIEFNATQNAQNTILEKSQVIAELRQQLFSSQLFEKTMGAIGCLDKGIHHIDMSMVKQPIFTPAGCIPDCSHGGRK